MQVYEGIFDGAFGTPRRTWVTIRDAMMLLCIGVGLAPAFKMRFWNIGAEGQILIGGIVTAGFMRAFGGDHLHPRCCWSSWRWSACWPAACGA